MRLLLREEQGVYSDMPAFNSGNGGLRRRLFNGWMIIPNIHEMIATGLKIAFVLAVLIGTGLKDQESFGGDCPMTYTRYRDGYKFWHLSHPPVGMTLNAPAPSREAEIESRKKVFRLS